MAQTNENKLFAEFPAHAACLQARNDSSFDVVDQALM